MINEKYNSWRGWRRRTATSGTLSRPTSLDVCRKLRDEYKFDCLSCLTGSDRGEFLEVVYHIFSYSTKESAVLESEGRKTAPSAPTITGTWPSADWMERSSTSSG